MCFQTQIIDVLPEELFSGTVALRGHIIRTAYDNVFKCLFLMTEVICINANFFFESVIICSVSSLLENLSQRYRNARTVFYQCKV